MNLPKLDKPQAYTGLYVFDFRDHTGVGFTAQEVAELLESESFQHGKVYKIHKAYPDGRLELKGVPNETFQLESGMFFYAPDRETATRDYKRLIDMAVKYQPPCKVKVHMARVEEDTYVTAVIYPAEYEDEISSWMLLGDYYSAGTAEGGVEAVGRYYQQAVEVLERHQLYGEPSFESRTGETLLSGLRRAVQR